MKWLFVLLLVVSQAKADSVIEIAAKPYLVASAFGGDILDANYRADLKEDLKRKDYFGVILTDYDMENHLERLKDLDFNGDLLLSELKVIGEKIFISFTRELYSQGFDVATYGAQGITYVERGLVSFSLLEKKVFYSDHLWSLLPLEDLPHLNWEDTFTKEVCYLKEISLNKAGENPFYKLSFLALEDLSKDRGSAIRDFRASLKKAGLQGSQIDQAWQRLEEIFFQLKRQELRNR